MKFILIAAFSIALVQGRLPEGMFQKCPLHDPDLNTCMMNSIESVRSLLRDGIREISFPALDPFSMDAMPLKTLLIGLKLKGAIKNVIATGAGDFKIKELEIDVPKKAVDLTLVIPRLDVLCDYYLDGAQIVLFKLTTSGKFMASFENVQVTIHANAHLVKGNGGLDYLKLDRFTTAIDFGQGSKIRVTPNSTTRAATTTADLINSLNAYKMLRYLRRPIDAHSSDIIRTYVGKVLQELPLQDLLEY